MRRANLRVGRTLFSPFQKLLFRFFPASYKPPQFLDNFGVWLAMYIVPLAHGYFQISLEVVWDILYGKTVLN